MLRASISTLSLVVAANLAVKAQAPTLATGSSIALTLTDGRRLTGRVMGGDSGIVILGTSTERLRIHRTEITSLSKRSGRSRQLATQAAVIVGGGAAIYGAAAAGPIGAIMLGALSTPTAALIGFTVGAFVPRWRPLDPAIAVTGPEVAWPDRARCWGGRQVVGDVGLHSTSQNRDYKGYGGRMMVSIFCEPTNSGGFEVGFLHSPETVADIFDFGVTRREWYSANMGFGGLVGEHSFVAGPIEPALITGIGVYRRSDHLRWQGGSPVGSFTIATWDRNTSPSGTPTALSRRGSNRRSAVAAMPATTPWLRRSSACSRRK